MRHDKNVLPEIERNKAESYKTTPTIRLISALIGLAVLSTFVLGLSYSISTGSAGFKGGLPFATIALFVILLVAYDVWDECKPKRRL